ncbi:MAG: hypothetical protein JJU20_07960 [Opitutales bacterium]|nr:hypothetical protein [Opitutales bacterium]
MFRLLFKLLFNLALALIAAVLTVAVVVFFVPDLQKSILLHFLEKDPRRSYQMESFKVFPDGLEARGIFVLEGLNGVEIKDLELRGSLLPLVTERKIVVSSGNFERVFIDLSQMRVGDMLDMGQYLNEVGPEEHERWMRQQSIRSLSLLDQRGWDYDIRDVQVQGSLLLPDAFVDFQFRILEATPDGVTIELEQFSTR